MTQLRSPFEIPGYRFVRRIGRGGMASVYLALQDSLKRPVAIKILTNEQIPGEKMSARFEQEARTIARLDHPHIVSIYDVGRDNDGQLFYTMPYLPNGDLRGQEIGADENRIIDVMRALASALGYAHTQGIVHRDVKPENVLFDALKRPLLADFGIAFSTSSPDRLTREGATLGSSGYMSPEQAMGQQLDGRSDLYSLGVLCYEMLTGDKPFHRPDSLSMALAHLNEPVRRLPAERRHWQTIIDKTLAKNPDTRFQNAEQLLAALDDLDDRLASGLNTVWTRSVSRLSAAVSPRYWLVLGAVTLVLLLSLAGWKWLPRGAKFSSTSQAFVGQDRAATPVDVRPVTSNAEVDRLLIEAQAMIERGQLIAPEGHNATEQYLKVLRAAPANREASAALQKIFKITLAQNFLLFEDNGASDRATNSDPHLALQQVRDNSTKQKIAVARRNATVNSRSANSTTDKRNLQAGERLRDPPGPELVYVPKGEASESNQQPVLQAFAIAATDVTRGEYAEYMRTSGRTASECRTPLSLVSRWRDLSWRSPGFAQEDNHPVVCVSWRDALAYVRWLSQKTRQNYRLPTQQEWLHVARQITATDACSSGNVSDRARGGIGRHYDCNDGFVNTSPVGSFPRSPLGIADLSGNVSVWMGDCANTDCTDVWFRGLSWRDGPGDSNLERRGHSAADIGYTTIGLRVVRSIGE
jgi:serine/threonine-protein kinase PpkA